MSKQISKLISAQSVSEGAGVKVYRSIGNPAQKNLDPFLMLDQFGTDNPDDYIAGFPSHPHRGFNTFTYMLDGHMQHRDSMGNRGDLKSGGAQWMKAGSGVIHSEMPQQTEGRMRGFQLWVNLPAAQKMTAPVYQDIDVSDIPEIHHENTIIRLLAGSFSSQQGPVSDPHTQFHCLDITLAAKSHFTYPLPQGHTAFLYLFEGTAQLDEQQLAIQQLAVLQKDITLNITADTQGARLLLVTGKPIHEPIVQYGPFVMNTRQEIEQALADYRQGRLVSKASC